MRGSIRIGVVVVLFVVGCGTEDTSRHNLSGTVTYRGAPVPAGTIIFEPDSSKGNHGPQGYSSIVDGHYQTDKFGKGAMTGPIKVQIAGFPAPKVEGEMVNDPLFPAYKTSIEITPDTTTFDFEVPTKPGASR